MLILRKPINDFIKLRANFDLEEISADMNISLSTSTVLPERVTSVATLSWLILKGDFVGCECSIWRAFVVLKSHGVLALRCFLKSRSSRCFAR